ncbi:MAG: hypothetical protein A2504_05335 [Bdellovibrionales bacterium RIFOXYD12_FULL_39_22]|nr:MAG: hypothetical protein A2385_06490 [Bdellovibrionales bacterium RIFOXYB1_FULL_39_21]OFZ41926.1 MAG: hypothetical protein A2485_08460 [Bdellovibrionales bacterium RIFOXYC12_FULL_39_17]OFZ50642.1 MAG: hypothetical protein A2404_05410 [Bdellovibrionales bacterium RIFOXYC1_FULL_39_130]OFZ71410.1 MAG: hypothetical protein A2451_15100 [Bdellovibrionales bacterium RIFOXYC2_FULL_39_8]OFZ77865.1 MAG: hypothetical protein A2560_00580 [Bdellovibrionales bacterium RIFOXYD1_FULL_39_84]OFZ93699.1 MAG:
MKQKAPKNEKEGIVLESSLQGYFFDQLKEINGKLLQPLPNETLYYSSRVMDRFGQSTEFFETVNGKYTDKFLGKKLLEAEALGKNSKKRILQDVGDTSLFMCGFFYDAINSKIVDYSYYESIGRSAYSRLNAIAPTFLDIESFYASLAKSFSAIANLISIIERKFAQNAEQGKNSEAIISIISPFTIKTKAS